MPISFPGESEAYRAARNALLAEELALRAQTERVAELRRGLPSGGSLAADYVFTGLDGRSVPIRALFKKPSGSLAIYSLMYRPDAKTPCPMCTSMLDGLAGQARHISQVMDFVVVAAARPDQLRTLSENRGWQDITLLSAQGTNYQSDYHAEDADGAQWPMMNVFRLEDGNIAHFWGSEVFYSGVEGHPRHVDQLWPLWNMLDLAPQGRGTDWYPALSY